MPTNPLSILSAGVLLFYSVCPNLSYANLKKGEPITILSGSMARTTTNIYGRLLAEYLGKHIPGKPRIVFKTMPGAGGLMAASHCYQRIRPDEHTICQINGYTILRYIILEKKLKQRLKIKPEEFNWIGRISIQNRFLFTTESSAIKTLPNITGKKLSLGAVGKHSFSYQASSIINQIFGANIYIKSDHKNVFQIEESFKKNSIDGYFFSIPFLRGNMKNWMLNNRGCFIAQIGNTPHPLVKDLKIPLITSFAKRSSDRKVLQILSLGADIGISYVLPPKTDKSIVKIIRNAFKSTSQDPDFIRHSKKQRLTILPMFGKELSGLVNPLFARAKNSDSMLKIFLAAVQQGKPATQNSSLSRYLPISANEKCATTAAMYKRISPATVGSVGGIVTIGKPYPKRDAKKPVQIGKKDVSRIKQPTGKPPTASSKFLNQKIENPFIGIAPSTLPDDPPVRTPKSPRPRKPIQGTPFYVVEGYGGTPARNPSVQSGPNSGSGSPNQTDNAGGGSGKEKEKEKILPPSAYFVLSKDPEKKRQELISLGTVLVTIKFPTVSKPAFCTGSHLGNRMILTAYHCIRDKLSEKISEDIRIIFGPVSELPKKHGEGIPANPVSVLNGDDERLDYLLLELSGPAPKQYRGAILPLSIANHWKSRPIGTRLESTLIWTDELYPPVGKSWSTDNKCVTKDGRCRAGGFRHQHGCDTSNGSSGAPMFLHGGTEVIAIHVEGDQGEAGDGAANCAVPTSAIIESMSRYLPNSYANAILRGSNQ